MRLSYFCLVFFGKTIFVLWLFIRRISRRIPPYVTVVWYLYLVKGVLSRFCSFLDKGVGCELPEKLVVEIGVHCNGVMKHWSKEVENEYEDDGAGKGQIIPVY